MLLADYINYIQPAYKPYREDWPLEKRVVFEIMHDLVNRRGFRQLWDKLDDGIREELLVTWVNIVDKIREDTGQPW